MLDLFSWIVSIRSDTLTSFFKVFPFFASDSFYILVIAVGYWRQPRNRLFWDLGFLVPFSTLLNCVLKNLFSIPRPDHAFHLVPVHDPFGFPSGDIQVAVVFWGMICLARRSFGLSFAALCLVATMMFSRLYLGVHSPYDVIVGFFLGGLTLLVYYNHFQSFVSKWLSGQTRSYWIIIFWGALVYFLISRFQSTPPMVVMALGALIGYGLSLQWREVSEPLNTAIGKRMNLFLILLSLGILGGVSFIFPIPKEGSKFLLWVMGLTKYAFLVVLIYILMPRLQRCLRTQLATSKDPS